MIEFQFWLYDLELQTLTDDLKQEIFEMVEDLVNNTYNDGFFDAKQKIINHIEDNI
jgi:hypothetical protein